ncbi:hypothetical protein EDC04DRAFT_2944706 [Pisolithus marmoratus]|nr:hypothetical protein EDC04DRAFT_2944706 [Pisolithus marmoratus]
MRDTLVHQPVVAPWAAEPMPAPLAPKSTGDPLRKHLVPKKSKLCLLGLSSSKGEREQDFSNITRRIGASMQNGVGFEIYIDPAEDPDIGDILLVRKKKSHATLDGMTWGMLGKVTNIPSVTKPKENKEKSGKKEKEGLKVKVDENQKWWSIGRGRKDSKEKEEHAKSPDPTIDPADKRTRFNSLNSGILLSSPICAEYPWGPVEYLRVPTLPTTTLAPPGAGTLGSGKDSVAMWAMRSVCSLARIGSWAQLRGPPSTEDADKKDKEQPEAKKKKKKKEKAKVKETVRYSGSSFEAGALSASPVASKTDSSGFEVSNGIGGRLSVDSANILGGGILAHGRSGSTMSTASSLRPRKERESKKAAKEKDKKSKQSKNEKDSNRKVSDSRKRKLLAAIFPGTLSEHDEEGAAPSPFPPIVTVEEAAVEECSLDEATLSTETPGKRTRLHPMSEQLLSCSRPKAIYDDGDDNAVISLLDAATNDLAQLINRLDLEATLGSWDLSRRSNHSPSLLDQPGSPTPLKNRCTMDSPVRALHANVASITSLQPYGQAPTAGQPSPATIRAQPREDVPTVRMTHKLFKVPRAAATVRSSPAVPPFVLGINETDRSPSAFTFGSAHLKSDSHGSSLVSPVFKKAQGHARKQSSLVPDQDQTSGLPIPPEARCNLGLTGTMGGSVGTMAEQEFDASDPDSDIPDELQVILSNSDQELNDTMSFNPNTPHPPLPSPRLPLELLLPVPGAKPPSQDLVLEVPIFHATLIDEDNHQVDIEEAGAMSSSEEDMKKSFDFTGEINKLNESGTSHWHSFMEQLECAFHMPAKIDLRYDFGNFFNGDVPPVPKNSLQDKLLRARQSAFSLLDDYESHELLSTDFPINVNAEPSLLPGTDRYTTTASDNDLLDIIAPQMLCKPSSMGSCPSDGKLKRDFKFGGQPSPIAMEDDSQENGPLTLLDIIPRKPSC